MGGTTTYYVGNWFEVTSTGATTKYYYFGGARVALRTSTGVTYLHGDHLGSTSVASNESGALVSRQTYYPFGAPRTTEVSALPTDYTFTGQKFDASAGLMYYGARYYDATLGRFISADTVVSSAANPQALNRYAYVLNNPVRYTDPTGQGPCGDVGEEDCEKGKQRKGGSTDAGGVESLTRSQGPRDDNDICNIARCESRFYLYDPSIEDAFRRGSTSPTASAVFQIARNNRIYIVYSDDPGAGGWGMLINGEDLFGITWDDTIYINARYRPGGAPIPVDLLVHEIVHFRQQHLEGQRCCSMEQEREAYTFQHKVLQELATTRQGIVFETDYLNNTVRADIVNGRYVPQPNFDYETFRRIPDFVQWIGPIPRTIYPPAFFP